MLIAGIETSCDETSVAVLEHDGTVRANLIASQIERHRPYGGVVPEIASREHLEQLMPLLERALQEAKVSLNELDAIAVTSGPGLIGALLVGVGAAQGLSYGLGVPLLAVNHLEGHIFSAYLRPTGPATPRPERFFSLVVSGGHSSIYEVSGNGQPTVVALNRTRDDAGGEVFDKVAKFIGLPYPGGPHVERLARGGDPERHRFAIAQFKDDSADFSFSGLKANAIRLARELGLGHPDGERDEPEAVPEIADFCASFQKAIGDQIIDRLDRIADRTAVPSELGFAGGVAANGPLRERVTAWCVERGIVPRVAERRYCTDNAAMIAFAGLNTEALSLRDPKRVQASSRLAVGTR